MSESLTQRIRWYAYLFTLFATGLFAQWAWWAISEDRLYDVYRDMGAIECWQIILLAAVGLLACLLSIHRARFDRDPLVDGVFGQVVGAFTVLLIFRELDYFVTFFMDEPLFLKLLSLAGLWAVSFLLFNIKLFVSGIRRIFKTPAIWPFAMGSVLYAVLAQIVGHRQFRALFFPDTRNFIRRFLEENLELAGIFLLCVGMLELHIWLGKRGRIANADQTEQWTEALWNSFQMAPRTSGSIEGSGFHHTSGGTQVATREKLYTQTHLPAEQQQPIAPVERITYQMEELERTANRLRRSQASTGAAILVSGAILTLSVLWFGYVQRESAIESSTNAQVTMLLGEYQSRPEKWRKTNSFRYQEIRQAIRNDVSEEYNFSKLLKFKAHRE